MRHFAKDRFIRRCASFALTLLASMGSWADSRESGVGLEQTLLLAYAELPAATQSEGPPAGAALGATSLNGQRLPTRSQPVQGFSALLALADDEFLALSDNGFGNRDNSADFLLRIHRLRPDFRDPQGGSGNIAIAGHIGLHDPDHHLPFPIIHEASRHRPLTGADLDPESLARAPDGTLWIGDEFGPYLLHVSAEGRLLEPPYELPDFEHPGQTLRSPDNPRGGRRIGRSAGFEGLGLSPDGRYLYAVLEKPLLDAPRRELLISQFDRLARRFTGVQFRYPLASEAMAVGEFILISNSHGLALERDEARGAAAAYKRVHEVRLGAPGSQVQKREKINLLSVADPAQLSGTRALAYAMPFANLESLALLPDGRLAVLNDNNYPYAGIRDPAGQRPDASELVLLTLPSR